MMELFLCFQSLCFYCGNHFINIFRCTTRSMISRRKLIQFCKPYIKMKNQIFSKEREIIFFCSALTQGGYVKFIPLDLSDRTSYRPFSLTSAIPKTNIIFIAGSTFRNSRTHCKQGLS